MAISATTEWDVRTTGSDTNAGGFDKASSGTDYSQQDAAQIIYTDLVIGGTNTQLTSAANPFTSAHVGNIVNVTSGTGFTTGRYQVVSVAGAVATMDRAVGTASSTGGAGKLGGALATNNTAMAQMVGGNTVHTKAGTYTETITMSCSTLSATLPGRWIGYQTTHRDRGTKPLITTAANTMLVNANWSGGPIFVQNLSFSSTAGTRNDGFNASSSQDLYIEDCIFDGFRYAIMGDNGLRGYFNTVSLLTVEIKNSVSGGVYNWGGNNLVENSYIHNNGGFGYGISTASRGIWVIRSVIAANATGICGGASAACIALIVESDIANNTGTGVTASQVQRLENSILYGNGGYGVDCATLYDYFPNRNNAYGSNTSGPRRNLNAGIGDVALTANPFTNSAGGDYSLNSTAGGGAACKGAGYQSPF